MKYAGPETALVLFWKRLYAVSDWECGVLLVLAK
jgi:hypothetical protein